MIYYTYKEANRSFVPISTNFLRMFSLSSHHSSIETYGTLLARILVGGMFLFAGVTKVMGIDTTASMIDGAGLPLAMLLAWVVAVFEIVAGAALIVGYRFKDAALALAIFTILASFVFHGPSTWEQAPQMLFFMKNMGIVAALLYMAAYGPGKGWVMKK